METDYLVGEILYIDEDYGVSFEEQNGNAQVHCRFNNWSVSTAKHCKATVKRLIHEHRRDAYGVSIQGDTKHERWLKFMDFEHYINKWILDENGDDAFISIWIRRYQ